MSGATTSDNERAKACVDPALDGTGARELAVSPVGQASRQLVMTRLEWAMFTAEDPQADPEWPERWRRMAYLALPDDTR